MVLSIATKLHFYLKGLIKQRYMVYEDTFIN
jgi:hypothetical protein